MADPPAMSQVIILPDSLQLPGPADAETKLAPEGRGVGHYHRVARIRPVVGYGYGVVKRIANSDLVDCIGPGDRKVSTPPWSPGPFSPRYRPPLHSSST
jgi:hypothetical protein